MDERKMKVLKAIIQDYIATAEPVGSRTIARKFNLGVSPATIRNEMADLEELGLIEQPHTSAGRVPSEKGYRYYVNCLMEPVKLTAEQELPIKRAMSQKIAEIQDIVAQTSRYLSQLTSLTAIVFSPLVTKSKSNFYQMNFLEFQPGKTIMVIGRENGTVEHQVIDIGENITIEDLQRMANVFNQKMRGHSIEYIQRTLLHEIYNELAKQKHLIDYAMDILNVLLAEEEEKELIHVGGTLNILNQPEFRDLEKAKSIFKVLEENSNLKKLFNKHKEEGLTITIGGENIIEEFKDCSLVSATYKVDGETFGAIGVLGPKRMDYEKVVAIVDFMTNTLTEVLSKGTFRR